MPITSIHRQQRENENLRCAQFYEFKIHFNWVDWIEINGMNINRLDGLFRFIIVLAFSFIYLSFGSLHMWLRRYGLWPWEWELSEEFADANFGNIRITSEIENRIFHFNFIAIFSFSPFAIVHYTYSKCILNIRIFFYDAVLRSHVLCVQLYGCDNI